MRVIILIGLPGSGKSTIAQNWFPNYVRINQDELGSRDECAKKMGRALEHKKDVIIDRVNNTIQQRSYWLNLAKNYGAESIIGIYLDVSAEECISRIYLRKNHPTIPFEMNLDKKRQIVYSFEKQTEFPSLQEGFSSIVITRN